jgi:choline dehydrogenase-like flavoprotein
MPKSVAIVGSGIAGATLAYLLTKRGHAVTMFEAGPEYPYPHSTQYADEVLHKWRNPAYVLPADLQHLEVSDEVARPNLKTEQIMHVGGMATRWSAWTPRYMPHNFKTRSLFGRGFDWPIDYDELEPYYCKAEAHLGISGTDDDNPFAPRRSKPYPLPAFPLSYDDEILGARLRDGGILLHTVPQARTSGAYDGRPACANIRTCGVCPLGVRYSPNHHLALAQQTGRFTLHANAAVRAITAGRAGQATAVVYHPDNQAGAVEHPADVVIIAAGAIESARLLLLSARDDARAFNPGGHVGRNLLLKHIFGSYLVWQDRLYPGRAGARTAQSYQFMAPTKAQRQRGFKIDFSSALFNMTGQDIHARGNSGEWESGPSPLGTRWADEESMLRDLALATFTRTIAIAGETIAEDKKYVALSATKRDRFGAPFAHVHHHLTAFDHENHELVRGILKRFGAASGATETGNAASPSSGHHHLGTCRMGKSEAEGVVDSLGRVHGFQNLFVAGGSIFPANSAANPTLTIVALAFRTAEAIMERFA